MRLPDKLRQAVEEGTISANYATSIRWRFGSMTPLAQQILLNQTRLHYPSKKRRQILAAARTGSMNTVKARSRISTGWTSASNPEKTAYIG